MTRFALALLVVVTAAPAFGQPVDAEAEVIDAEAAPPPPVDPDPDRVPGLDDTSVGIIQASITAPIGVVQGRGVKIGEGTAIYPMAGIDTGFVSNVYYTETDPAPAGLLRLIAGVGTGSLSAQRLAPRNGGPPNLGSQQFRGELRLNYDFYLSGNDFVQSEHGLGIDGVIRGHVRPQQTWSFLYLDNFQRLIRPTNFEEDEQTNRDINRLALGLQFAPAGRSMRGMLHYENVLDVFEKNDQRFANRFMNTIGVTAAWRFRPMTVLFADVSQGIYVGIGHATVRADQKASSYPLTVSTGIQTLLTLKTSLVGRIGYTNGFYSRGASYSAVTGGLELGWRYSPLGRAALLYEYTHDDSINANFYRDHKIKLTFDQQLVPVVVSVSPEIRFRRYEGISALIPSTPGMSAYPDTRDDVIYALSAGIRYNFRDSFAAVLQYQLASVQTDYRYMSDGDIDDPSYIRHELVAGVRAAL